MQVTFGSSTDRNTSEIFFFVIVSLLDLKKLKENACAETKCAVVQTQNQQSNI